MRGLRTAGCVLLVLAALVLGGRLWSDAPKKPAPRSRIALLNLGHVIKYYKKFQAFQQTLKSEVEVYQKRDKEPRARIEGLNKELAEPGLGAEEKEGLEKQVKRAQRQLEDNANEVKAFVGKKNDEQMVILYREVQEVAQLYAVANGIELVLHYNDALPESPEYYSPMNVARKMQAGACVPLYATAGLDISNEIIKTLNARWLEG